MSKFQPSRSQVPVDERSVLATVPGLPWWGAVLTLLVFTAVGAFAAGEFAGANAGMLAMSAGAIVSVLAVRNRALFTAMVQPPLVIATAIPVYRWFSLPSPRSTSQILTDVLFPMISLFPWMFWITVIVLIIGSARLVLYRQLTATARSAQRSASAGAKQAAKSGARPTKKPAESAGLPIGARIRAALARIRPAPAAAGAAAGGAAVGGAAALVSGTGGSERHQKSGSRRSGRASKERASKERAGRERGERRGRAEAATEGRSEARLPGPSSAARSTAARDAAPRGAAVGRDDAPRRELTQREKIARRDEGAPATQINRVVRPDSGQIRRGQPPRRPVGDDRRADVPRGARIRPAVAQGDRPRPGRQDSRELRREADRGAAQARMRGARAPEPPVARDPDLRPDAPSGPRRAVPRPDPRDYRREAGDIDRARGVEPPPARPRERSRIPRDDYASLPRISGTRVPQPDLPSLSREAERPAKRGDAPSSPGRYEHYRAPRYRPQSEETPVETNFRDDFTEPAEPRPIRRHRYKD